MKVAVTGVGLVCPAGVGLDAALARLAQGPLEATLPAGEGLPGPPVLRIPDDFEPKRYARRRKDLKLMARANKLAVAAARLAVEDAGLTDADLSDAGLFLGVGLEPGNLDDIVQPVAHSLGPDGRISLDRLVDEGMSWMHPLSSLKTLPNMSVAHVSIVLGLMGPSQALCAGPDAGLRAVREGALALLDGRAPVALVGAADSKVAFPDRVSALREDQPGPVGEAAAILVLEPLEAAEARGATIHAVLDGSGGETSAPASPFGACGAATAVASVALRRGAGLTIAGGTRSREPVAITGVGLATPLGHDLSTFGEALLAGRSAAAPVRAFDAARFPVRNACEVKGFDIESLPDELAETVRGLDDRKSALALAAAARAVADRGGVPAESAVVYATGLSSVSIAELHQDCGPFVDAGAFDYAAFAAAEGGPRQAPWRHQVDRPAGILRRHFGLSGPSACHFSACAAGAAAVGHAADMVRRGEAPVAIAGAGDSMVHPFGMLPFILLGATSTEVDPARVCRPFDQHRDGFVMGEGGAFFVLEPLSRARAEGRHVHGLVLGWGCSTDAYSVTAPHPEGAGAERAIRAALTDAGIDASAVDYVNAHGTGTPLNDVTEASAIRRVFGASAPPVSSSKAQLGHAIAAAGALELLGCLAALDRGALPPNAHLETPDPKVDVDLVGRVGRPAEVGVILSNSFGFGGQNACLAVAHRDWDGV